MGHPLISTAACKTADKMALEKATLGDGATVVELRRKTWDSHDMAYVVQGVTGVRKEVIVTSTALKRRLSAAAA